MILEIDIGAGFVPVSCLTDVSENETVELIGTTTRQNGSWKTSRPTRQNKTISIGGLLPVDTALFTWEDLATLKRNRTQFTWRIDSDTGVGFISDLTLEGTIGDDVSFSATIVNSGVPVSGVPAGYTVAWVDDPVIGPSTAFDIINGEIGATYDYTITSSGGGTPITGSGTIGNANTRIFKNISSLGAGTLTVTLTLTNNAGTGAPATDDTQYTPIVTPVGISISAPNPTTIEVGGIAIWTVTYTDADSITLAPVDILFTNGFTGTINVVNGPDPATQRNVNVSNIQGTVPGTTELSIVSGTATNGSGGSAPSIIGGQLSVTEQIPAGYSVAWLNDPVGPGLATFRITGGSINDNYDYTITSSGGGTPITGSGSLTLLPQDITEDITSLPFGTLTVEVTLNNSGGTGPAVTDDTQYIDIPQLTIGPPVPVEVNAGQNVDYTITYTGADAVTLAVGDVTQNITGDVVANTVVSGSGTATRTVQLQIVSGTGTIGISIDAGTATNAVGSAPAAGPSSTASIISGVDTDAQAFIDAVEAFVTLSAGEKQAIDDLVVGLKTDGVWTKMDAIYPLIGGTGDAHKFNLKNPADTDAAFRLQYTGGVTHNANGMTGDGSTGYADTHYTNPSPTDFSIQVYVNSNNVNVGTDSIEAGIYAVDGAITGGAGGVLVGTKRNTTTNELNLMSNAGGQSGRFFPGDTGDARKHLINTLSGGVLSAYVNGQLQSTNTIPSVHNTTLKNFPIYLCGNSNTGSAPNPGPYVAGLSNQTIAFAAFGQSLTPTEASDMFNTVQAYQTALGRNNAIPTDIFPSGNAASFGAGEANATTGWVNGNGTVISSVSPGRNSSFAVELDTVSGTFSRADFTIPVEAGATYAVTFDVRMSTYVGGTPRIEAWAGVVSSPSVLFSTDGSWVTVGVTITTNDTNVIMRFYGNYSDGGVGNVTEIDNLKFRKLQDADAQAFFRAIESENEVLTTTEIQAVEDLVIDLKGAGLWDKINALYPFVGSVAQTHKYNLKNPDDTDAAFRITWAGTGVSHAANGVQFDGTVEGYGDSHYIPSNNVTLNSETIGFYSNSNNTPTQSDPIEIGAYNSSSQASFLSCFRGGNIRSRFNSSVITAANAAGAIGFFAVGKNGDTTARLFKNGVVENSATIAGSLPTNSIRIGQLNLASYTDGWTNQRLALVFFAGALSDAEVATLNTAVQTFQTTLGRQNG